jgi:hypothetical protein
VSRRNGSTRTSQSTFEYQTTSPESIIYGATISSLDALAYGQQPRDDRRFYVIGGARRGAPRDAAFCVAPPVCGQVHRSLHLVRHASVRSGVCPYACMRVCVCVCPSLCVADLTRCSTERHRPADAVSSCLSCSVFFFRGSTRCPTRRLRTRVRTSLFTSVLEEFGSLGQNIGTICGSRATPQELRGW